MSNCLRKKRNAHAGKMKISTAEEGAMEEKKAGSERDKCLRVPWAMCYPSRPQYLNF